jgi:hypothetical protein
MGIKSLTTIHNNQFKMKKFLFAAALTVAGLGAFAQNVQLHYDYRRGNEQGAVPAGVFTSTVEMFKPDSNGSTFFFVDMNYGERGIKGVSLAYWEIARSLKFWDGPLAAHIEYNGGLGSFKIDDNNTGSFRINDAWLLGVDYSWNNSNFTRGFTLEAMYKYIQGFGTPSYQLTGVWYMHLLDSKVTFSGFADFWKQTQHGCKFVFLTEPQLWYNFNKHISVGGEVEVSRGFVTKNFAAYPTTAVKWNF